MVKSIVFMVLLALLSVVSPARAQGVPVEIGLELFGAGGVVRPGDWCGVRLALRDPGAEIRPVRVAIELRDGDGDTTRWEREATLNPGQTQGMWLYARLPFSFRAGDPVRVRVSDDTGEIASSVVSAQTVIDPEAALYGLVGRAAAGLDGYRVPARPGVTSPATGHEWIEFALMDPDQIGEAIPDAWMGLGAMKTIVWTQGRAGALRAAGAEAMSEWVRRGGHLVIVVPADGGGWESASGALEDLVPLVEFRRREGVDLNDYRPLLTADANAVFPSGAIVHEFAPRSGASERDATPVFVGPTGDAAAVRRLAGAGAVTLVGIDVGQREVSSRLDPQRFWHRLLGERFDVLSSAEMDALRQGDPPPNFQNRTPVWLDDAVEPLISKTGRAGAGVLLGFVVFSLYWVVAGPGGFALLRWGKRERHSWVAFVVVAGVFTAIAWGGAAALRPVRTDVTHLTFVDQVHGEGEVRARSWVGALLPRYGTTELSVESSPGLRHALAPWDAPGSTSDSFPDPRVYTISARRPEGAEFPSRATVKQVRLDWLGAPPWGSIDADGVSLSAEGRISGALRHGLPSGLEDVTVMLVLRQQAFREASPGALQARTLAWRLTDEWGAGETLDLGALGATGSRTEQGNVYLDSLSERARGWAGLLSSDDRRRAFDKLELLTWAPVIGPPAYTRPPSSNGFPALVSRRVGHGLDLGRWFTQPCVIVTGRFQSEIPSPLRIDGTAPPSDGVTMLRWVYPLPASPPALAEDRG